MTEVNVIVNKAHNTISVVTLSRTGHQLRDNIGQTHIERHSTKSMSSIHQQRQGQGRRWKAGNVTDLRRLRKTRCMIDSWDCEPRHAFLVVD